MMNMVWTEIEKVKENELDLRSGRARKFDVRYYLNR